MITKIKQKDRRKLYQENFFLFDRQTDRNYSTLDQSAGLPYGTRSPNSIPLNRDGIGFLLTLTDGADLQYRVGRALRERKTPNGVIWPNL